MSFKTYHLFALPLALMGADAFAGEQLTTTKHFGHPDSTYPCVAAPLPSDPIGPTNTMHFDELGFTVHAWRYPCDGDRSVPMMTIVPDDGVTPFFCGQDALMVQGNRQSTRFQLVEDPLNPDDGFCNHVVVPTTLALMDRGGGPGHMMDFDGAFSFHFESGQQHAVDMSPYHADDYGVDSMGHAIIAHRGLSGIWFDAASPGQGLSLQVIPGGIVVFFFGYDIKGERLWLISSTEGVPLAYGDAIELTLWRGVGGAFGAPQPETEVWGRITISFDDCDHGSAVLDGSDGVLSMSLTKLAGVDELRCY